MSKTILLSGATDGIGLLAAEKLVNLGHTILIHGRNRDKLARAKTKLSALGKGRVESYCADLSQLSDVALLAETLLKQYSHLDVLINNAGVYKTPNPITPDKLDSRFVVNTLAPYLLSKKLLAIMNQQGRIINLSSAAQAPVDLDALAGKYPVEDDFSAYAQSKLAITMWSRHLAQSLGSSGPVIIALNPGSLLASKMVKEGFGIEGKDLNIGADIVVRTSLEEEFASSTGIYFDNDIGERSSPHPDGLNDQKSDALIAVMDKMLEALY